jgi:hypothetical protein
MYAFCHGVFSFFLTSMSHHQHTSLYHFVNLTETDGTIYLNCKKQTRAGSFPYSSRDSS